MELNGQSETRSRDKKGQDPLEGSEDSMKGKSGKRGGGIGRTSEGPTTMKWRRICEGTREVEARRLD